MNFNSTRAMKWIFILHSDKFQKRFIKIYKCNNCRALYYILYILFSTQFYTVKLVYRNEDTVYNALLNGL